MTEQEEIDKKPTIHTTLSPEYYEILTKFCYDKENNPEDF